MLTTPLDTERLCIRRFTPDDWPEVHAYTSNPATMHFIPEGVMDEVQTKTFVMENAGDQPYHLPLILKANDQLIGHLTFHPWYSNRVYEIGWVIHPEYHGQGYATESAMALLRHGFETLGGHRVIATCQPQNPASYRVMEKIGMQREGHLRQCIERPDGTWWDEYFYAILADEWFAQAADSSIRESSRKEAG